MDTTTTAADFKGFYRSLDSASRERFASAAETTTTYIEVHLVYGRRIPRPKSMEKLVEACVAFGAPFGRAELLDFFYGGQGSSTTSPGDEAGDLASQKPAGEVA